MNLLPGWAWRIALAAKRPSTPNDTPEPGDMGTAFGLDASLAFDAPEPPDTPKSRTPTPDRVVRRPRR